METLRSQLLTIIENIDYDKLDTQEAFPVNPSCFDELPLRKSFIDYVIDQNRTEFYPFIHYNPALTEDHISKLADKGYFILDRDITPIELVEKHAKLWCELMLSILQE